MSSDYGKIYAVDVPVIDLDESETELFEIGDGTSSNEETLDDLEYNPPRSLFTRLRDYFNGDGTAHFQQFKSNPSGLFSVDDDDDLPEDDPITINLENLRNYKIKRLNQKLNKAILAFACGLVFCFGIVFISRPSYIFPRQKRLLSNSTHNFYPTTILVSLDGFHPHYISEDATPTLHKMLVEDYGAPYITPSFPSSTFPNHWTLITGLHPSEHGIVGNTFYDPVLGKQFVNTNRELGLDPDFWRGGEPIWKTAALQGVSSAVHMWPGSEVPTIGDDGPLFVDRYNGSELLSSKLDRVMGWLDVDDIENRPELILTYVPTIDSFGHKYGIAGDELSKALGYVDNFVHLMILLLEARNLSHIVNLVVVSDHGMATTSNDRLLFLDDLVNMDKIEHVDGWPLFGLRPFGDVEEVYNEIKTNLEKSPQSENFSLFKLEDFPPEYQFGGKPNDHAFNYRLAPIWLVPDVGYSITTHKVFEENNNSYSPKGVHGYNNTHLLMRAIFLAKGPYFQQKLAQETKVLPFSNLEVYNILCDSLDVKPPPNNGTSAASKNFAISKNKVLPTDWSDNLTYPDLPYEVEHIVLGATYDKLWRLGHEEMVDAAGTEIPYSSVILEESTVGFSSIVLSMPSLVVTSTMSANLPSAVSKTTGLPSSEASAKGSPSEGFFDKVWDEIGDLADQVGDAIDEVVDQVSSLFGGGEDDGDESEKI